MLLPELLKETTHQSPIPALEITDICSDSRLVKKGSLFFALVGTRENGGRYIAGALKGGASAVVAESDENCPTGIPLVVVKDARQALARAACQFYQNPTSRFYLCGVTGTNGKTTLTYLLEKIWLPENSGVLGTVNIRYKNKQYPNPLTTPDTVTMQKIFAEMAQAGVRCVAAEISSHALEQKRAEGSQFDSAVFTNLTQDHLDYHQGMEAYFQAKSLLFDALVNHSQKKNRLAVINRDDDYGKRLIRSLSENNISVKTFSMHDKQADIVVRQAEFSIQQTRATLFCEGQEIALETNLLGQHNLRNIMAAILVALHSGQKIDAIISAIKNVRVPGRLDRVLETDFFVDYAHTPDALTNVLSALREVMKPKMQGRRLSVVFGCGGDRDKGKRPLMGEAAARLADLVLVTSDNPRTENPGQIIEEIMPGVRRHQKEFDGNSGYLVEPDRHTALKKIVELTRSGDVVVVAGKGHEDYQILGTQKIHFDDREILRALLEKK